MSVSVLWDLADGWIIVSTCKYDHMYMYRVFDHYNVLDVHGEGVFPPRCVHHGGYTARGVGATSLGEGGGEVDVLLGGVLDMPRHRVGGVLGEVLQRPVADQRHQHVPVRNREHGER